MSPQAMPQGIPGGGTFTYQVSDPDKESWRPAWRLEVGRDGQEYGKPMKLPKDAQALARYLAKRRLDGGRLFTLQMPARISPQGQFECFVAPEACKKRANTKGALVDHMEGCHPAESKHYAPFIQQIRDSIAAENPALAKMVQAIAATPDNTPLVVPNEVRETFDADVPDIPAPEPYSFSVDFSCPVAGCDWKPKADAVRPVQAQTAHIRAKHPEEVNG